MEYRRLGRTDIDVSLICLGTMTWGEQNSEADGHAQLDYALDQGVNFIDTAEMYAVPPREATYGRTEEIIGSWLEKTGRRKEVILASKVSGRAQRFAYARPHLHGGETRLDRQSILEACEGSLRRLKTDYIDLYQVHWPDRSTNFFGQLGYVHNPDDDAIEIEETLSALDELVRAGKVRHVGVSNETPWGMMRYLQLAESMNLPRIASIQDPYNLLFRQFEVGSAEVSCREQVGLLAYSPLAMGTLSGKYLNGQIPEGSRMALFGEYFPRYQTAKVQGEIAKYVSLAREYGLDPAQMALAFVNKQVFVTSNIIGATTMTQLETCIGAAEITLPEEVLHGIAIIHKETPFPTS